MSISSLVKKLPTTVAKTAACLSAVGVTAIAVGTSPAQALSLSNGSLTLDINDSNGAISSVLFGGSEFYQRGAFVSNFGFQNGTNTSTFATNTAFGSSGVPVTVTSGSGSATVNGSFTGGGANISFSRVYSLVPGLNVIRTITTFVNNGADTTLSAFDTFDPDQGLDKGTGFGTFNDVLTLVTNAGLAKVGQATESGGLSVVIGSLNPATIASGNPFQIGDGFDLNAFFDAPFDDNGSFADSGTHIGLRSVLTAGSSLSFAYDQAFGLTSEAAQAEFIAANGGATPVPTPALLPGLIGVSLSILRKRKAEAAEQSAEV
ncbi:MAG: PTPA-CTERM sorting domain-containing protein [Leptolyngbyaceae cyanobacterium SM1_3_5]|nr:PTPA-CTERM sorting domain-containing protein [Leptolyngbyaceae cyanobacterium SM1_3_5]